MSLALVCHQQRTVDGNLIGPCRQAHGNDRNTPTQTDWCSVCQHRPRLDNRNIRSDGLRWCSVCQHRPQQERLASRMVAAASYDACPRSAILRSDGDGMASQGNFSFVASVRYFKLNGALASPVNKCCHHARFCSFVIPRRCCDHASNVVHAEYASAGAASLPGASVQRTSEHSCVYLGWLVFK
jgi:hypothetical protein